ncbi:MAG: hypothetical protein CSA49_05505 [Gammaproteobacteria bacterium]|nr:MAG: hypothetical protein CSA49_05505 [Gammaproteobacteria bacterium]
MQHTETPEYTYTYHWGRIAGAIAVVVVFLFGIYYWLSAPEEKAVPPRLTQTEQPTIEAMPNTQEQAQEPEQAEIQAPTPENNTVKAENIHKTDTSKIETVATAPAEAVTPDETASAPAETVTPVIATTEIKIETVSEQPVNTHTEAETPTKTDTRTKAELFTAAIKRAKLTAQVSRKEPGDSLPYHLAVDPQGLSKVYFYTEVVGQAGKTHYHHWYRNGKLKAKVPIAIGGNRWRCYSSKYLTQQQAGEWTVKVIDAKGRLLAKSSFNFANQ